MHSLYLKLFFRWENNNNYSSYLNTRGPRWYRKVLRVYVSEKRLSLETHEELF